MTRAPRLCAHLLLGSLACGLLLTAVTHGSSTRFYSDDPMQREPETQDASKVRAWEIDLFWDLAENLFANPGDQTPDVKARNVSTVDEVPDSNWFTNRIGARPLSIAEAVQGPLTGAGPAPGTWSVVRPKEAGFAPGFTMEDATGERWFVSFDAKGFPEAATGAILVANKIFWALGYWQVENYLVRVRPDQLVLADSAVVTPPSGTRRRMKFSDLEEVLRRSHRSPDGSYRAIAARAVPGRVLGGFRYYGTRPDDPNDVVPHEHRRELRALKVFGAWTNLVDMKAGNTLDSLITENGKSVVRHYLQDVGSTFGTGANAPREFDEGWEYLFEGDLVRKRLLRMGFFIRPWQTARYVDNPSIGRFEGTLFDPAEWKPRVPTAAFRRARADDTFWAARRVMAFSDEMIHAIVATGRYSDESAAKLLADVLIQRRDKIGRTYLKAINPVADFALDAGAILTFDNAAVAARVGAEPTAGYVVSWSRFDNATGSATPLGRPTPTMDRRVQAPVALPSTAGTFVKAQIVAVTPVEPAWARPVDVYFRRSGSAWTLVGVDRLPAPGAAKTEARDDSLGTLHILGRRPRRAVGRRGGGTEARGQDESGRINDGAARLFQRFPNRPK
jgi:hypothetical protein